MQAKAFQATKALLCSDTVLGFYSLEKPVAVACDSSDRGCGAVLYHVEEQGLLKPVMYVSKLFRKDKENGPLSKSFSQLFSRSRGYTNF